MSRRTAPLIAHGFQGAQRGGAGAVEGVLMARVDHHLQHPSLDLAGPYQLLNGIFERLDPLPSQAAYVHERRLEDGREMEPGRPVDLVADEDALFVCELGEVLLVAWRQRFGGVEHVQDELRLLQGFPAATDAFEFSLVARLAQAGGVNEYDGLASGAASGAATGQTTIIRLAKRTDRRTFESNVAGSEQLTQNGTAGFPALDKRTSRVKANANVAGNQQLTPKSNPAGPSLDKRPAVA